jgi:hypothetical protein
MKSVNENDIKCITGKINVNMYLIALLFAIGFKIIWLIYVFSIMFGLGLFIYLNRKYKFIYFKQVKNQ